MHISSSYAKILGETNFHTREFPRSGSKAKDGERKKGREKERLNDGNNNGQLRIANVTPGGARKATWAKTFASALIRVVLKTGFSDRWVAQHLKDGLRNIDPLAFPHRLTSGTAKLGLFSVIFISKKKKPMPCYISSFHDSVRLERAEPHSIFQAVTM